LAAWWREELSFERQEINILEWILLVNSRI
jgi:hypothetical protein